MISPRLPAKFVAIDTESNGLYTWEGHRMFAASAVFPDGRCIHWRDEFEPGGSFAQLLEDPTIDKVFQNAKHDWAMIEAAGLKIRGRVWDTMIFAHTLNPRQRLSLEDLSFKYLPSNRRKVVDEVEQYFAEQRIPKKSWGESFALIPPELLEKRCTGDAALTLLLFMRLYEPAVKQSPMIVEQEHDLIEVVMRMSQRGVSVDLEENRRQGEYFDKVVEEATDFICDTVGFIDFNINSHNDVEALIHKLGIESSIPERTKTGKLKLDARALIQVNHPVTNMLLIAKNAAKMAGTFVGQVERLHVNGILHANFNALGTVTGRFSSSHPNLQNIPKEGGHLSSIETQQLIDSTGYDPTPHLKRIFQCRPGYAMVFSDKSRIELRLLAHYSGDPTVIEYVTAHDVHTMICMRMFGEITDGLRWRAKRVVFGWMYGIGVDALQKQIPGATRQEAKDYLRRFDVALPGAARWKRRLAGEIYDRGYVTSIHGRRHYLYGDESYMAVNRLCQGTAADEVKSRMIEIHRKVLTKYPDCHMLLNIHDDICTEVPLEQVNEVVPIIHNIMQESCVEYKIPMPSETSVTWTNWTEAEVVDWEHHAKTGVIQCVAPE